MMKALLGLILLVPAAACDEGFQVAGTVTLAGPVPAPKPNKAMNGDPACCALHAAPPARDNLVVGPKGGVRWAFVYVKAGLEGKTFLPPADPVQIEQVGCRFEPHVVGIVAGQAVSFKNNDPMLHNIHGLGFENNPFNFGQLQHGVRNVTFPNQEVMFKIVCDVHPWMSAHIGVVDHPYFAVTDAQGAFVLPKLPPGKYTLGVWHEELKGNDQEIEITAGRTVDFVMVKK